MKVLHIAMGAAFTEGYSYQDNLLPEYQHKLGHNVTILTGTETRDANGKIICISPCKKKMDNGVQLIRIESGGKLRRYLGWYPQIKKEIQNVQPDFIFVHGLGSLIPAHAAAYKKKKPQTNIVADNHQDFRNTNTHGIFALQIAFLRLRWKAWLPYFSRVYGTTDWRTDFAETVYGIPKSKLDTLLMGIDDDNMAKNMVEVRQKVRKKMGLKDEDFVFISGGKIDKKKKIIESMRAFSQVEGDAKFLVFGPVADNITNEFRECLSLDHRITYIGAIPSKKIYQYFVASDYGVFPGGHSVLWNEASGCGLPCVFSHYSNQNGLGEDNKGNVFIQADADMRQIFDLMKKASREKMWYHSQKQLAEQFKTEYSYYKIAEKSLQD